MKPASTLLFLPLAHVLALIVAIGCVRARVRLGHAPSIRTEDLLADLAGFQPTFLFAIPDPLENVDTKFTIWWPGKQFIYGATEQILSNLPVDPQLSTGSVDGPGLPLDACRHATAGAIRPVRVRGIPHLAKRSETCGTRQLRLFGPGFPCLLWWA